MLKKRGVAHHFEMIVSFLFFVTFTAFLLLTLNPYTTTTLEDTVTIGIYDAFLENISVHITEFSLSITNLGGFNPGPSGYNCFQLADSPSGISIQQNNNGSVASSNGNSLESTVQGTGFYLEFPSPITAPLSMNLGITDDPSTNSLFTLAPCPPSLQSSYYFGGLRKSRIASYQKILDLKVAYDSDYENVKKSLNIPDTFDFAIISEDLPATNMQKTPPQGVKVKAEEYLLPVAVAGNTVNARFIIQIW